MAEKYDVEAVVGHGFEKHRLQLKTTWSGWPAAAFTWEPAEVMEEDAKESVKDYFRKLGVHGLSDKEKEKKLKETAIAVDRDEEKDGEKLKIVRIVNHKVIGEDLILTAHWSNGEDIDVNKENFPGARGLLKEYLKANGLVPAKRRRNDNDEGRDATPRRSGHLPPPGSSPRGSATRRSVPKLPLPVIRRSRTMASTPASSRASSASPPAVTNAKAGAKKPVIRRAQAPVFHLFWESPNGARFCIIGEGDDFKLKKVEDFRLDHPQELADALEDAAFVKQ